MRHFFAVAVPTILALFYSLFAVGASLQPTLLASRCALTLMGIVDPPVRSDLRPSLQKLVNEGPERWVDLPTHATGQFYFIRGLSGGLPFILNFTDFLRPRPGVAEAFAWLSGDPHLIPRYVGANLEGPIAADYNSALYGDPLTVRGRTNRLWYPLGAGFIGVNQLPPLADINSISSVILLLPLPVIGPRETKSRLRNYLNFIDRLRDQGIQASAGSRGERFEKEIRIALASGDSSKINMVIKSFKEVDYNQP